MKLASKVLLLSTFIFLPIAAQAWVKSISIEKKFVGDNIRILEVAVKCNVDKTERKLRKNLTEKTDWCSVDLPNVCSSRKVKAAREICQYSRDEYRQLIADNKAESGSTPKAISQSSSSNNSNLSVDEKLDTNQELMQEKILIEEQRIKIAQLQLELKRKELQLRSQLVE